MLVEVIGNKPLRYGGKKYKRGDVIDMSRAHSRVFSAIGRVRDVLKTGATGPTAEELSASLQDTVLPEVYDASNIDSIAETWEHEPVVTETAVMTAEDAAAPTVPRQKRKYTRRDITRTQQG